MKILQVIAYFTPQKGGDVNVCYNLSKQLAQRGHEVTIVTTDHGFDKEYAASIEKEGVNVISFHCLADISAFLVTPSIRKWLKFNINDFDLIHMHNFRSYQNNIVHHYAMKHRVPYVLQAHGSVLPHFAKIQLKKLYDLVWGYKILRYAAKAIALTSTEVNQYIEMGVDENKLELIPNGIDVSQYENLPSYGDFRNQLNINNNEKIILFLGRIHKIKGLDLLVDAVADLLRDIKDCKLVIVGPDDGYLSVLKKQTVDLGIENKVLFTGPLYGKDKLIAYIDADVVVYPGVYEIFGLVPFEAIICGTPIIVTDNSGCGEIVKKADCGYLIKYGDVEGLKNQILYVLNNSDGAKKKVLQGQKYIYNNLTWDKIVTKVEDVYENCIRNV